MQPRNHHAWLTPLELGLVGAIWGSSFLLMRVAMVDLGAFLLVEIRLALGASLLLPFLWRDRSLFGRQLWPKLFLIGAINSALPFVLFAWAAKYAPAGILAITNSTVVLMTALVGFLFFREKVGMRRALALLLGFGGVVILASGKTAGASLGLPVFAGACAAFLYGIGAHLVRRLLVGLPPVAVAASTLAGGALFALPFAAADWPTHALPMRSWFAAAMLGLVCTGLAYALFYRLIQRIGAGRAVAVTYLVPAFSVAWAWWLLDEPLTMPMAIAGLIILGSVALSERSVTVLPDSVQRRAGGS